MPWRQPFPLPADLLAARARRLAFSPPWRAAWCGLRLALAPGMRLSFAVITALCVVTGCAAGDSDVCGDAAEALAACGFDVPADFDTRCAADPEMFAVVPEASC